MHLTLLIHKVASALACTIPLMKSDGDTRLRKLAQEFGEPYDLEVRCRCDSMARTMARMRTTSSLVSVWLSVPACDYDELLCRYEFLGAD